MTTYDDDVTSAASSVGGSGRDAVGTATRPRDFTLVTPAEWYRIPLIPEQRRSRAVDALIEQQFRGIENQPRLRREMRDMLVNATDDGIRRGGVELYMSLQRILDIPMPASLLVCFIPPDEMGGARLSAGDLARLLGDGGGEIGTVDLPAGRAVRRRRRSLPKEIEEVGANMPTTTLDFFLPVPQGEGAVLLLTFSTPVDPVADAMVEMFDAVAGTLHWVT